MSEIMQIRTISLPINVSVKKVSVSEKYHICKAGIGVFYNNIVLGYDVNQRIKFYCDRCHRCYSGLNGLNQHKKYQCGKEPQFVCTVPGCSYKTKLKCTLKRHMIGVHRIL